MASFCFWGVARQRLSTPNLLIICVRTCAHTYTPPSPHTYIHAHIYTQAIHPFHLSCYVAQLPWPRTHYFSCSSWVLGFIVCTVMPSLQIFLLNFCNYTMKVDATLICIIGKTWMMKKIQIIFYPKYVGQVFEISICQILEYMCTFYQSSWICWIWILLKIWYLD